jgi:hypothetical protein
MTYVKVSVPKPGKNAGAGGDKKDQITIFDFDDVLSFPARDSGGVVITDNIVFKANAYMIDVYATPSTIAANPGRIEGEEDAEGFMMDVKFSHPGGSVAIRELITHFASRNCGIVIRKCSDNTKTLFGNPCAPLRMKIESVDDKDKAQNNFSFETMQKSQFVAADYQGTLTFADVTDTVDADATSIDLAAGEGRYQLTDNTVATVITTCTNATNGIVFTFIGSGGDEPATIVKENDFILASGATWTGLANAEITFKAFKSDAAAWTFIELSRK